MKFIAIIMLFTLLQACGHKNTNSQITNTTLLSIRLNDSACTNCAVINHNSNIVSITINPNAIDSSCDGENQVRIIGNNFSLPTDSVSHDYSLEETGAPVGICSITTADTLSILKNNNNEYDIFIGSYKMTMKGVN